MPIAMSQIELPGSVQCEDCLGWFDAGAVCTVPISRMAAKDVCPNCAELAGFDKCSSCGDMHLEAALTNCDGDYLCDDCRDDAGYVACERCGDYYDSGMSEGADGYLYCESCHDNTFNTCCACGAVLWPDDTYHTDRNETDYCADCVPASDEWEPARFNGSDNTYNRIGSRAFGVEIETSCCDDYQDMHGDTKFNAWGVKEDGSISGMEFVSAILNGDRGLAEVEKFCDYAKRNRWCVDDDCGLHVHFDMRGEDTESLRAITLAYYLTYDVWSKFVDPERCENMYCRKGNMEMSEITQYERYRDFAYAATRNRWINFSAYIKHTSIEVRFHESTLDAKRICAWIRAHEAFIAWAKEAGFDGVKRALWVKSPDEKTILCRILFPADVAEFYGCTLEV